MKLIIEYTADFGDRESFESLFDIITKEGIPKNIIPSSEFMKDRMPLTVKEVKREIIFRDE